MREYKKRKASKRPAKNEFEEIIELKLKKACVINKDDITDFQIDFGLYNKSLEKALEESKKSKPEKKQGKKKCVKRKEKATGHKYLSSLKHTKKSSVLKNTNIKSDSLKEKKQKISTQR